ncbi:hypothetical protein Gotri_022604 [Gossypium trilobum]|uniref:Uncharacterized protein n=1 Tax=Gossypium trilobum TaxID=34281 RepID=A0A7J9DGK5_9ROSI|nr:hypothetical protein [Gossypium trilobum]
MTTQVGGFLGVRNLAVDFKNHVDSRMVGFLLNESFSLRAAFFW